MAARLGVSTAGWLEWDTRTEASAGEGTPRGGSERGGSGTAISYSDVSGEVSIRTNLVLEDSFHRHSLN